MMFNASMREAGLPTARPCGSTQMVSAHSTTPGNSVGSQLAAFRRANSLAHSSGGKWSWFASCESS